MQNNRNCSCGFRRLDYSGVDMLPPAMAYVPDQRLKKMFDHATALQNGTVFPELCKPFCGKGGACL